MTLRKQVNFMSTTRCNLMFGLFFLLGSGIPWLTASQAQPPNNALANNDLIQKLSNRNLNFAFHIYKLMANQEDAKLSPFGISVALTMISFGAGNNTLKQVNDALDLNGFQDHMQIAKAYNSILKSLDLKGDITLTISNRILIDKSYHIKEAFREIVVNEFRSVAESVNFFEDGQVLNKETNQGLDQLAKNKFNNLPWLGNAEKYVEDVLFNAINSVKKDFQNLPLFGNAQRSVGAVLVSAIYFKGKWAQQFQQKNTKLEKFLMANKKIKMVAMMNTVADFYYAEDEKLRTKVLKMDFSGSRLVTFFILPNNPAELGILKASLTAEWFKKLTQTMQLNRVMVKLPKFNSNFMKELSPELKNLNIFDLENQFRVDLSNIAEPLVSGSRLFVEKVVYAAYVEMSEGGAEAIAHPQLPASHGLGKGAVFLAANKKRPVEFIADHPFVFIIYDTTTNFILFIGNVDNPSLT